MTTMTHPPLIDADGHLLDQDGTRNPELQRSARNLLESKVFIAAHMETERKVLISRPYIQDALNIWAPAYRHIGTPKHESVSMHLREKAAADLNAALEQELVLSIREALALGGLTDQDRIDEICRVVIAGS